MTQQRIVNQLNTEISRHENLSRTCRDKDIAKEHSEAAEVLSKVKKIINAVCLLTNAGTGGQE